MAYRWHGKARVDPENPEAFAIDDRSGFLVNLRDLQWQYEWAGQTLINLRLLVREQSYDIPQEQLRTIVLPPDPPPVYNARPESYFIDETDFFTLEGSNSQTIQGGEATIITEDASGDLPIVGEETPTPAPSWQPPDNFYPPAPSDET